MQLIGIQKSPNVISATWSCSCINARNTVYLFSLWAPYTNRAK